MLAKLFSTALRSSWILHRLSSRAAGLLYIRHVYSVYLYSAKSSCFEAFHNEQLALIPTSRTQRQVPIVSPMNNMSLKSHSSLICLLNFIVFLLTLNHAMALPLPLTPRQEEFPGLPLEIGHEFKVSTETDTLGFGDIIPT